MNIREEFLKSVEEESPETFLRFMEQHNSRNESFDVEELLQTLPKKEHERLWAGLRDMTHRLILTNPLSSLENDDFESDEEGSQCPLLLPYLEGVTTVALFALTTPEKSTHTPPALLETAVILHGLLMVLPEGAESLQNNIAQLCESWFLNELEGKEELVTHALPYLIIRSLNRGIVSDVKRVWSLRQALLLMDFEDNSSESMKQLLHQCMIHPMYLKLEEGRRFLSYLFGLNPELSKEFHKTIKNQIPSCAMNVLSLYGEVYFRAWRVASGPYLKVLEENCFQDLMYSAVHAQRSGTQSMASRLRKVLEYFHQQKKQRGVDEALLRLYQPIIWRAFKVANPMVRANATALLTDTFPLQNPDAGNEEIDALLQKQFDILKDLLEDPCPTVRATAIHGVCRITGVFWELIPAHVIKMFLTTLINDLAFDTSSSAVRVAVFQGLKFVLDNRLSHPLLKPLLANLQDLVHDTAERVRVAFLDVLILVKGLKAIKFWNIVPLEQLLSQLEVEQSAAVIRRIVKLLVNSFHPTGKGADTQVTRCSALWQSNPVAARKFYQYVHLHSTVSATGKFMVCLCHCLVKFAQKGGDESNISFESESEENRTSSEDKENTDSAAANTDTFDAGVLAGMAETVAICWGGIKDKLEKGGNESTKTKLVDKFTKALPKLFGGLKGRSLSNNNVGDDENVTLKHPRIQAACLVIAGFLPSSSLPAFSAKCLSSLSSLPVTTPNTEYGSLLNCLCAWDRTTDVLELINEWVVDGMNGPPTDPRMVERTGRKKKSVAFQLPMENKQMLALEFLSWLMGEPTCRTAVQGHPEILRQITDNLRMTMSTIESRLSPSQPSPEPLTQSEVEFFHKSFEAYCLTEIHLHHMEKNEEYGGAMAALENVLVWADRVLLPAISSEGNCLISRPSEAKSAKRVLEEGHNSCSLMVQLVKTILTCLSEMVMLGLTQEKFYNHAAVFTTSLAKLGCKAVEFLPQLAKVLYQIALSVVLSNESGNVNLRSGPVSTILQNLLEILLACDTDEVDVLTQALLAVRPALAEVLLLTEVRRRRVGTNAGLMGPLLSAVINNIKQQGLIALDDAEESELPMVAAFVMKLVSSSQALLKSFMLELKQQVLSGATSESTDTQTSVLFLLSALQGTADTSTIKACALHINDKLTALKEKNSSDLSQEVEDARLAAQSLLSKLQVVS